MIARRERIYAHILKGINYSYHLKYDLIVTTIPS